MATCTGKHMKYNPGACMCGISGDWERVDCHHKDEICCVFTVCFITELEPNITIEIT